MLTLRERLIASSLSLIMLMELVDSSALNTVLPQMALSFDVNVISLKVAITVYLLTLGLFIPASAWMSDRFGVRRILTFSVIGFVGASIACGLSQSLWSIVIFRALQGFFGAFTMPVARLAMVRIFKGKRLYAMSLMAAIATTGPMLGPLVGGALATFASWRLIFFINVPIGIVTLIALYKMLPQDQDLKPENKFDYKGFIMIGLSIALFMFVLDTLIDHIIPISLKLIALVLSILLMWAYLYHAKRKAKMAVIDVSVFQWQVFRYLIVLSTALRIIIMGMMFLFPLYLQIKQGYTPLASGAMMLSFVISSWIVRRYLRKIIARLSLIRFYVIALVVLSLSYLIGIYVILHYNVYAMIIVLAFAGLCFGAIVSITNTGIYNAVEDDGKMGAANVVNSTVIQLSGAFSVAWVAIVLAYASGLKEVQFDSVLTLNAFATVMGCYVIGVLGVLIYVLWAKPKNLAELNLL